MSLRTKIAQNPLGQTTISCSLEMAFLTLGLVLVATTAGSQGLGAGRETGHNHKRLWTGRARSGHA